MADNSFNPVLLLFAHIPESKSALFAAPDAGTIPAGA